MTCFFFVCFFFPPANSFTGFAVLLSCPHPSTVKLAHSLLVLEVVCPVWSWREMINDPCGWWCCSCRCQGAGPSAANGSFFPFLFNQILLLLYIFLSISPPSSHFFTLLTGNPERCYDNPTEIPGDVRLPMTYTPQSRSQWGSESHVTFDKSVLGERGSTCTQHFCLSKYGGKVGASAII